MFMGFGLTQIGDDVVVEVFGVREWGAFRRGARAARSARAARAALVLLVSVIFLMTGNIAEMAAGPIFVTRQCCL